jgi:hypothetical protein
MLYVLTGASGGLIAWAPTEAQLPTPPANSVTVERAAWDAPPPLPYVWSPSVRDWVVPTLPVRRLTKLEFASRFTLTEQVAIEQATETHPTASTRATLRVLAKNLDRATDVDVTDPRTILGAETLVDLLITLQVVAAEDRQTRLDALLAP